MPPARHTLVAQDHLDVLPRLRIVLAPGAILDDTRTAYESMDRIRQLADRILMTHDREVRPFQVRDFPSPG